MHHKVAERKRERPQLPHASKDFLFVFIARNLALTRCECYFCSAFVVFWRNMRVRMRVRMCWGCETARLVLTTILTGVGLLVLPFNAKSSGWFVIRSLATACCHRLHFYSRPLPIACGPATNAWP